MYEWAQWTSAFDLRGRLKSIGVNLEMRAITRNQLQIRILIIVFLRPLRSSRLSYCWGMDRCGTHSEVVGAK